MRAMQTKQRVWLWAAVAVLSFSSGAFAQQGLKTPEASPEASVSQTVGVTEMTVHYHRPGVGGRAIWDKLVPYGDVWRAGANENTTVTFSTPVKVGGKPLAAGTYGLHMIPKAKEWTVIFSNMSVAWGSFTYNEKEDALRVTVSPQPSEAFEERLSYRFDNPTQNAVTLALRWEKLKVPVAIEVDTPAEVMTSMRAQLRGPSQFSWQGWQQAARYWATNGGDIKEAEKMADRALNMAENFQTLSTRAIVVEKQGDKAAAEELRTQALAKATEADLNQHGYALLADKKLDEAISVFQKNVQAHPASWNVHDSLAEALMAKGDKKAAAESYAKALALVKEEGNKKRIEQTLTRLKAK